MFLLLALLAMACDKDNDCENGKVTLSYAQTACADPWQSSGTDQGVLANVSNYLDSLNLLAFDLQIQTVHSPAVCLACTCKTGKIISLRTYNHPLNISKFNEIGFQP
jgi:hypothetical protein